MSTPDKQLYLKTKRKMEEEAKEVDCEVVTKLQGFPRTVDPEDDETDDDEVTVGTDSETTNIYEVMKQIKNDSGFKRKTAAAGRKKFAMKIWAPRNGEMTPYKAKQQIAKQIKVTQVDGYNKGRVVMYITAEGDAPDTHAQDDLDQRQQVPDSADEGHMSEAAGQEEPQPQTSPPYSQNTPNPQDRKRTAQGEEYRMAQDGGEELDEEMEKILKLADLQANDRNSQSRSSKRSRVEEEAKAMDTDDPPQKEGEDKPPPHGQQEQQSQESGPTQDSEGPSQEEEEEDDDYL